MQTNRKSNILSVVGILIVVLCIAFIKFSSLNPGWIEVYYSEALYPHISWFFRLLFGWIPFSLGDVVYGSFSLYLLYLLFVLIRKISRRRHEIINYKRGLLKAFYLSAIIYIFFNLSWGLNYNRLGIAYQLDMSTEAHSVEDLRQITEVLIEKVNKSRLALGKQVNYPQNSVLYDSARTAYTFVAKKFPFLHYPAKSIKSSLYGKMGNWFGFLGYYNPFTGEAQVNTSQPKFLIPAVATHEIAHQLGYAREGEANFVGYLAASQLPDTLFKYSIYFDLFNYANRELYYRDSITAKNNVEKLDTLVKSDRIELKKYLKQTDNYVEPIIKIFYDQYLRFNQQDKGIKSYNEVIGLLIAYYKKFGSI